MGYEVHRVPFPPDSDGVLRSYTELVMVNGVILVPQYAGYPVYNAEAMVAIQAQMPTWTAIGIGVDALDPWGAGLASTVVSLPPGDYTQQQAPPGAVCGDQASCQAAGCGDVTYAGHCASDTVVWCEGEQIFSRECSTPCAFVEFGQYCERQCGLVPAGYYDCFGSYACGGGPIFADGFESVAVPALVEIALPRE
jgi:hypothetical protein